MSTQPIQPAEVKVIKLIKPIQPKLPGFPENNIQTSVISKSNQSPNPSSPFHQSNPPEPQTMQSSPTNTRTKRQKTTTTTTITTPKMAPPTQSPPPATLSPITITFSPDDNLILYLFSSDGTLNRSIFGLDLSKGHEGRQHVVVFSPPDGGYDDSKASVEEKLRRERMRELGWGVTRYEWVKSNVVMVPLPTGVYFQDLCCSQPELKLPNTRSSPILDPHISPDGTKLAYVRDSDLHVLNLSNEEIIRLTFGANESFITHGLAEYIAQEEMDRKSGYWWSPDSQYIAFTQVDSSHVPLFRIMHQGKNHVGSEAQEDHPYPFTGTSNVKVKLGVVSCLGGPVTWMDLLCGEKDQTNGDEEYLTRVNWMPGNALAAQVLSRSHSKLKILKFDTRTGKREVLLTEENDVWINLHACFTPLNNKGGRFPGGFIWASERTGFRHLYLHAWNGDCMGPITEGEWMVEQICGVDEIAGIIYFTGTVDSPLESNLYRTSLFPDWNQPLPTPRRLTHSKGRHAVVLDHQMQKFVDVHDSLNTPPTVSLRSLRDGSLIATLYEQTNDPRPNKLPLVPPEIIEIPANDGTVLYGALYKPDVKKFGPPPYKTCISMYGGPAHQFVCDSWMSTLDSRARNLRNKGILIWKLDNRGTSRRGLKFESHFKYNFGKIDVEDQLTGVEWLIKQGLAKHDQIGLYGWSYGGFLSAITLARFPDTFRFAVCGAPPTSWDGYDTFYTEKYMGLPSEHPAEYESSSVIHHVENIKGRLLLVHGMLDENVHFRHTARLLNALVAAEKPYELLVFPDERHYPRSHKDLLYMEERIAEFVERNLESKVFSDISG